MEPIVHELRVRASAQEAYKAVATEQGIKGWWAKNTDVGERAGDKVELRFTKPDMSAVMNFEISVLEPNQKVEWTCTKNTNSIWPGSRLEWRVSEEDQGSTVDFRHSGFSAGGPPYDATVQGWQFFMESLRQYLDGGQATPSD